MNHFQIPTLSDYLKNNGWDIINDNFYLNNYDNSFVRIIDGQLHYFKDNIESKEVPLIIVLHYRQMINTQAEYKQSLRIIQLLENRGLIPLYDYHCFRFTEFEDEYWAFQEFDGIRMYTQNGGIETPPETGVVAYNHQGEYVLEDQIVKNLVVELLLLLNCDFFYDAKNDRFDIPIEMKKQILLSNKHSY